MIKPLFRRLRSVVGLDFHVATTLLLRSWIVVAGGVMVLIIPMTISPQQQGYYYTFGSLLGLQVFFELGLNQVITQLVSHEVAQLSWGPAGSVRGDSLHVDRIRSVINLLRKWYRVAAALFFVLALLAGVLMFRSTGTLPPSQWLGPWAALTAATAVNLYFSPMLAVTEGFSQVGQVARLRLAQSFLGYILTWGALLAGAGLWAMPLMPLIACIGTVVWLQRDNLLLRRFDSGAPVGIDRSVNWYSEVLPFQWRIAVSWMSGYLMFQLFTPLVFVHLGASTAGRLGMSISIFSALQSVGVSWINAKIPALTTYVSRGERRELDREFTGITIRACTLTVLGSTGVVALVAILSAWKVPHLDRVADIQTLMSIGVVSVVNTFVYAAASYMRAHRVEPMLPVSVVGAILTLVAAFEASKYGTFPTMVSQALLTVFVVLPWTIRLLQSHRKLNEGRAET